LLARRDSSKEEATMAASNLLRWAGLAALVGSVLIVLAEIVGLLGGVYAGTSSRGLSIFVASLFLLGLALVLLGVVGLYASQAQATGALGLIGFLSAFLGTTMAAGFYWAYVFVIPPVDLTPAGLILPTSLWALGWLIFGAATLRDRIYPRPAAIVLMIGAAISAIPIPATEVVLMIAIAWLGYLLFMRRESVAQTPPRVH
jgi:hypothetical protein